MAWNKWNKAPTKRPPQYSWSPEEMKMVSFVMKKGIKARDELIEAERKAAGLESSLKEKATDEFVDSMKDLEDKYREDLEKIEEKRKAAEDRDISADEASKELADKFDLRLVEDEDNK